MTPRASSSTSNKQKKLVSKLRSNVDTIVEEWLNASPESKDRPGYEDEIQVFLQLIFTRFEFDHFQEHLAYLSRRVRETWLTDTSIEPIMKELRNAKLALSKTAKSIATKGEWAVFEEKLDTEFCDWVQAVAQENIRIERDESDNRLQYLAWWDREVLQFMPVPVLVVDKEGLIRRANKAWCERCNCNEQELINKRMVDEYGKAIQKSFKSIMSGSAEIHKIRPEIIDSSINLPASSPYIWRLILQGNKPVGVALIALTSETFLDETSSIMREAFTGGISFGMLCAKVRKMKRMQTKQLAQKVELAKGYLSAVEHDKYLPSLATMQKIADVLDPDGSHNLLAVGIINRIPPEIRHNLPWL